MITPRLRRRCLLSSAPVSAAAGSPRRRTSSAATESSTERRTWSSASARTTHAHAALAGAFKRCCRNSGRFRRLAPRPLQERHIGPSGGPALSSRVPSRDDEVRRRLTAVSTSPRRVSRSRRNTSSWRLRCSAPRPWRLSTRRSTAANSRTRRRVISSRASDLRG